MRRPEHGTGTLYSEVLTVTHRRWDLNQALTSTTTQSMVCSGFVAEILLFLQQGASSFWSGPQNSSVKIRAKACKGHLISGLGALVRNCLFMVNTETLVRNSEGKKR